MYSVCGNYHYRNAKLPRVKKETKDKNPSKLRSEDGSQEAREERLIYVKQNINHELRALYLKVKKPLPASQDMMATQHKWHRLRRHGIGRGLENYHDGQNSTNS